MYNNSLLINILNYATSFFIHKQKFTMDLINYAMA